LFVDDFLIDGMGGSVERRLCHPTPRGVALEFGDAGEPWEGVYVAFHTVVKDGGRVLLYYRGCPKPLMIDESPDGVTCVAESVDGVRFSRPKLGVVEYDNSKENNIVFEGVPSHNFAPFKDPNPDASDDQRFKAIAFHVDHNPNDKGLCAYGSPDGLHWHPLTDKRVISDGNFDSQNLAFYDPNLNCYVCYYRDYINGFRMIKRRVSQDFLNWTDPVDLRYDDERVEDFYTNCVRPYFRAPHIYIGTPARFVATRTAIPGSPSSISDAVLMSSRDGRTFQRWEEGFIRPGLEPEVWTDRNNYPAWGMIQTSPEEISLFWSEHYRHPGNRLRRGTIRTDGFVSLHAGGGKVGETLTRPLLFSGDRLVVNYATSAVGTILVELCDVSGEAFEGFALTDAAPLFGNEIQRMVAWGGGRSDLSVLSGKPVRLRLRMLDADLYSIQFASSLIES